MCIFVVILNVAFSFIRLVKMAIHPSIHLHNHFLVGWFWTVFTHRETSTQSTKAMSGAVLHQWDWEIPLHQKWEIIHLCFFALHLQVYFFKHHSDTFIEEPKYVLFISLSLIRCFRIITSKILMAHERIL